MRAATADNLSSSPGTQLRTLPPRILRRAAAGVGACALAFVLPARLTAATAAPTQPDPRWNRSLAAYRVPAGTAIPPIAADPSSPFWKDAPVASGFYDPQTETRVRDDAEVRMQYDGANIYILAYCHEPREDVEARETIRDADMTSDDTVRMTIDPFLTRHFEDYSVFQVNPLGTRNTQLSGGRAGKVEWQGDWDAKARIVADGWVAEMRIPWKVLSYPNSRTPITMGINFRRHHAKTNRESMWCDLGPQRLNERDGSWVGVTPPQRTWKPQISALPYVLPILNLKGNSSFNSGVDLRIRPTQLLTSVTTLNPDFRSVEGAVESISFTRSQRYVPDLRPFFLEGNDYLRMGEPYIMGRIFYSGQIGPVVFGQKVYGKLSPDTTLGMLATDAPGREEDFVAQVRRTFGPTANLQVMALQRSAPGQDNQVIAIEPDKRWGKWGWENELVQSTGVGAGGAALTSAMSLLDGPLFASVRYTQIAPDFLDRLGLVPFNDERGVSSYLNWANQWKKGPFRAFNIEAFPYYYWHYDGRPYQRYFSWDASLETRKDDQFGVSFTGGQFDAQTDVVYGAFFMHNMTNRFRQWNFSVNTGKQADRAYTSIGPGVQVRVLRNLDISAQSFIQSFGGITSQHILTFNYGMGPYRGFGGRIVITDGVANAYLSWHQSGRRGTDTYVIVGDPNANAFTPQLMVKLVFALG